MSKNLIFTLLVLLRSLLASSLVWLGDYILHFETSLLILIPAAIIGVVSGCLLAKSNLRILVLTGLTISAILSYQAAAYTLNLLAPDSDLFLFLNIRTHLSLASLLLLINLWMSYLLLRYRIFASFEAFLLLITSISLFALHQNYRFDLVKIVNDLAWQFTVDPLIVITSIGFLIISMLIGYLFLLGNLAFSKYQENLVFNQTISSRPAFFLNSLSLILITTFFLVIANAVYNLHYQNYQIAVQNGVGSAEDSGISPLNFNSALGGSNQPAALVRLENDYLNNPHSPMIYLREAALSELKGNELVLAEEQYDPDIARTSTYQTFVREKPLAGADFRQEITQKIYLLGDHKLAFGIDYPTSITPLRLTNNKNNFKGAFKVVSLAPSYNPEQITDLNLGDPDWDQKTWEHYTQKHQDLRYQELALKLSSQAPSRLAMINSIIKYLDKNAIYTLSPNHEIQGKEDPTAKFLFGDLRGYCVHFAHATVYLLRALGIPSRIATGYLSDLSQAKDGHLLLRMSDRHAWAEVYLESLGWVPFDTHPEQVESHAETPVDQSLLDSLIDTLGTDEEIISDDLLDKDLQDQEESLLLLKILKIRYLAYLIILISLVIYLRKLQLLLRWKFISDDARRLKAVYTALSCIFLDLGFPAQSGETKLEYLARMRSAFPKTEPQLANILNELIYSERKPIKPEELNSTFRELFQSLNRQQKLQVIISPVSAIRSLAVWK